MKIVTMAADAPTTIIIVLVLCIFLIFFVGLYLRRQYYLYKIKHADGDEALRNIVRRCSDLKVRMLAVDKINDNYVLRNIVKYEKQTSIRLYAVGKINNQEILKDFAFNLNDAEIRKCAIMNLQIAPLLGNIFKLYTQRFHEFDSKLYKIRKEYSDSEIINLCNLLTDDDKRPVFKYFSIVDGKIIKTRCEYTGHQWSVVGEEYEPGYNDRDDYGTWIYEVSKCIYCGITSRTDASWTQATEEELRKHRKRN